MNSLITDSPRDEKFDTETLSGSSVSTRRYSEAKLEKTTRRSGTKGELGTYYEKKILMLGLYRAIKQEYDFTLDTNIEGFGALDDIVFTYKGGDGIERKICLQPKHNEKENKKIYYKDFLKPGNKPYALFKYFIDYVEITEKVSGLEYFVIYTNIDFNCDGSNNKGLRIHKETKDEYFIFKKLDLPNHTKGIWLGRGDITGANPLGIFSSTDSKNRNKHPAFYQFSDRDENDGDEKTRVINVLKNKFKELDRVSKLKKMSETELKLKLEAYLNALVFAVAQYDEGKLGKLIKEEMKQDSPDSPIEVEVNFIFEYVLNKIGYWKCRNAFPLTEKDDYFKKGKDKFAICPSLYPVLVYENELNDSNIRLNKQNYKDVNDFISSGKQIWLISSKSSWLWSLVIYQALKEETLSENTGIDYFNHDHHLILTSSDLLKGSEFVLSTFKAMKQSLLIIVCESTDPGNFESPEIVDKIECIVEKIKEIVSESTGYLKQVIVIAPENHKFSMRLKKDLTSYNKGHGKIEMNQLTEQSKGTCLATKKICFQGNYDHQFSIQQLIGLKEEVPVSTETLDKLSLDELALDRLLRSRVVEIGNEQPHLSHLESAYYKTKIDLEMNQLKLALAANAGDIFAFSGKKNEVKELLSSNDEQQLIQFKDWLPSANGCVVLLTIGKEEEQFKKMCHRIEEVRIEKEVQVPKFALHLLRKGSEGWIWTQTYSREFYMNRHFYPVVADRDKLKYFLISSHSFDLIIFSGTKEECLLELLRISDAEDKRNFKRNTFTFSEESNAKAEFKRLSRDLSWQGKSIHWLKVNEAEDQIQWVSSEGEINRIRSVLKHAIAPISEKVLVESKARLVVLADEPGMGKSTTLSNVAELMKHKNPFSWIIKIDLNRNQAKLASTQVKAVEDFVVLLSDIDGKLAEPLTRHILKYQLSWSEHVALLWDGFDEVKSERQDAILALFEYLKKETTATIWITTRRNDQRKLEERLSILAHPFEPLDTEKQKDYLSLFWAKTLKLTGKNPDESVLKAYAAKVIQSFEQSIQAYKGNQSFISIPLRARMLAEVYQDVIGNEHVESILSASTFKKGKQLGIGNLYQKFIARKYGIYLHEKIFIGKTVDSESMKALMRLYTKNYGLLALQQLFEYKETALFTHYKCKEFSLNVLSRIGLIAGNEEPVNFIHRTFAEYFAGKWLAEHTKDMEVNKFLEVQLFKKEFGVVHRFIDHFLMQDLLLHRAILEGNTLAFQESLLKNSNVDISDRLGRTALHVAAQEGRNELIQFLLKSGDDKLIRDQLGKTPLHYAACFGNKKAVEKLLEMHTDIELNDHILRKPLHFDVEIGSSIYNNQTYLTSELVKLVNERDKADKSPLYYAADNGHWDTACSLLLYGADDDILTLEHKSKLLLFAADKTHGNYTDDDYPIRPIVGLLSIQVPESVQVLSDDYEYPRLLSYFFAHGHTKVIDALLRGIENEKRRVRIANEPDNSCTHLERFFDSKYVSNSKDHLKIVRYFFEQGRYLGIKFNTKDVSYFLYCSAKRGFLETFRYLYSYGVNKKGVFYPSRVQENRESIRCLFRNIKISNSNDKWLRNLLSASCKVFGWTLLHIAAMNKNVDSIEGFLYPPIYKNINVSDSGGCTPLFHATATIGRSEFIESLFVALKTRNLNDTQQLYEIFDAKDSVNLMTPLHWVLYNHDLDSAKVLLKYIEYISFSQEQRFNFFNSRDGDDWNPVECLYSFQSMGNTTELLILLFKYIKKFNFSSKQCVEILEGSNYLLHRLIRSGFEEKALIFLKQMEEIPAMYNVRAAIVCTYDLKHYTPLHYAAKEGYCYRVVLSLLKNGAVFNSYSSSQETPLDIIEKKHKKTHFLLSAISKIFELTTDDQINQISEKLDELKEKLNELKREQWIDPKSILNARNREGKTLLDLSKHQEVADLLVGYGTHVPKKNELA